MLKIIGRSQKPVLNLIGEKGSLSNQEIGDQLYSQTSYCAKYGNGSGSMGGKATDAERRRAWAQKIVVQLRKKNLVIQDPRDKKKFILTEEGKIILKGDK